MRKIILYFALKYNGDYAKMLQAIKCHEVVSNEELRNVEARIKCQYVTIIDANYPTYLKSIATPPLILFYYGNLSLLNSSIKIALIGKRKMSEYGKKTTIRIVSELVSYQACIISGLALGIDSLAHEMALNNNLNTIAVLGSGIDYCYPKSNQTIYNRIKEKGLLISEYPNSIIPQPQNFLIRNRIIAAFCDYIVVIEANTKSGTMNTVSYGLEYNKEICCIPYLAFHDSGCNMLIKEGAKLIESARDIFD